MKKIKSKLELSLLMSLVIVFLTSAGYAQENKYQKLEKLQDQNNVIYSKIYRIVDKYPDFKYDYVYKDDSIERVIIEGVADQEDRKSLELLVFDFKKNQLEMKDIPTRTGIYYSVDENASPKNGFESFYDRLNEQITYPEKARDWGIEGPVYVKFIVDKDGNIPYARTEEDVRTINEELLSNLREEARDAILKTSGEWNPAKVNGNPVASWVVLPVQYKIKSYPGYPSWIR